MNEENNKNLDELVDRAMNDMNESSEDTSASVQENNDSIADCGNDFSGVFHERDSLSENNIVDEVEKSFLDYSMSVITSRAIPDLRDGLKPVHRRIYGVCIILVILQINRIENLLKLLVKLWVIITLMEIVLYMKQWLEWHKILINVIF